MEPFEVNRPRIDWKTCYAPRRQLKDGSENFTEHRLNNASKMYKRIWRQEKTNSERG